MDPISFLWNCLIGIITGIITGFITGAIITKMYREYDKRKRTIECLDIFVSYLYDLKETLVTLQNNKSNDFVFYQLKGALQSDRTKYLMQQFVDAKIIEKTGNATSLIVNLQSVTSKKANFSEVEMDPIDLEHIKINMMRQAFELARFRDELKRNLSLFHNP